MALMETGLYSKLSTTNAITDLVNDRIYHLPLPQKAPLPAISFQRISGLREHGQGSDPGVVRSMFQIDVWHNSYIDAKAIAEQVRLALQDFSGATGGVTVLAVHYEGDSDIYEQDTEIWHIALDFIIWYSE